MNYLQDQIITYIGNKRKLLPEIQKSIDFVKSKLNKEKLSSADLFSGSGIVSRLLKLNSDTQIANDLENYSYLINRTFLSNYKIDYDIEKLNKEILKNLEPGFITELYSPKDENNIKESDRVFYTRRNAMFIDTFMKYFYKDYPELIGVLLYKASVHVNTSGIFKGFHKSGTIGKFGGKNELCLSRIKGDILLENPVFSNVKNFYYIFKENANSLAHDFDSCDLVYLDPPYNGHSYSGNYFMLNLIADYKKPDEISKISGIPVSKNKSDYNYKIATDSFIELLETLSKNRNKYALVSYNNEGIMNIDEILKSKFEYTRTDINYNTFRGSRNLENRNKHVTEYLYLINLKT